MPLLLSPLYPILNASYLPPALAPSDHVRVRMLTHIAQSLVAAGVTMLQYRNKLDDDDQVLRDTTWLRIHAPASLRIILNDRAHLVRESGCDGLHIGQSDLGPEAARALLGPDRILGLSTHGDEQVKAGDLTTADYLAIGPVYATGSKEDAEAVVGLEGVRSARSLTQKPLVAIGGITLARAAEVRAAGADSLAVISALFGEKGNGSPQASLQKLGEDFLHKFR
jgi:thiamine-phosphate pyrophosphorylase